MLKSLQVVHSGSKAVLNIDITSGEAGRKLCGSWLLLNLKKLRTAMEATQLKDANPYPSCLLFLIFIILLLYISVSMLGYPRNSNLNLSLLLPRIRPSLFRRSVLLYRTKPRLYHWLLARLKTILICL